MGSRLRLSSCILKRHEKSRGPDLAHGSEVRPGGATAWGYLSVGAVLPRTTMPPHACAVTVGFLARLRTTHLVYGCRCGRPRGGYAMARNPVNDPLIRTN
jgi:hypothetical protein